MSESNAELLRRAAALMRMRADLAYVKGRWEVAESTTWVRKASASPRIAHPGHAQAGVSLHDPGDEKATSEAIAEHIASWDPLVAVDVAHMLEVAPDAGTSSLTYHAAVAIARSYLGALDA